MNLRIAGSDASRDSFMCVLGLDEVSGCEFQVLRGIEGITAKSSLNASLRRSLAALRPMGTDIAGRRCGCAAVTPCATVPVDPPTRVTSTTHATTPNADG